jgi:hypothetical protein
MTKIIETTKAQEFWNILSPQSPLFETPCDVIYRGQRDASWKLEPSFFRNENKTSFSTDTLTVTTSEIIVNEFAYLKHFVEAADRMGIALPCDSKDLRDRWFVGSGSAIDTYYLEPKKWPAEELLEMFAIAQHYETPTRLLDWSKRSYIAAYFAASGAVGYFVEKALQKAVKKEEVEGLLKSKISVWGLNITSKGHFNESVEIVNVPSGINRNIAAQSGCFTVLRQEGRRGGIFEGSSSLDDYFNSKVLKDYLVQVTLPVSEARDLLNICELYGITASTIYPDLYGASIYSKDTVDGFKMGDILNEIR